MMRNETFNYRQSPNERGTWEVQYGINGQDRRMATCEHEQDARDIVEALRDKHYPHDPRASATFILGDI